MAIDLAHSSNNLPSSDTAFESIGYYLAMALTLVVLIGLLCLCGFVLFYIVSSLVTFIIPIFGLLFVFMACIYKLLLWVSSFAWILNLVLLFVGNQSTVKMMKAPGKPTERIVRAVFEANPQEYFANLRR
ncbi:hypothetical protein QVD17_34742 [Tagetes erecta]|uniref:Uncharacterized protein n=1 Tax=Tagetes erecta TaxID=13708 RepID=A0AAD8K2G0_TARER|nr:hypothetical protein QVD17_34742 [Tagetes erecta]